LDLALKGQQAKANENTINFGSDGNVLFRLNPSLKVGGRLIREPLGQSIRIAVMIGLAQIDD
jgi:hypothetical protein